MIPKVIHYVWVGNNPKPDSFSKYYDSWKKYCPDWEIKGWGNEILEEIDNEYVSEAIEKKKWAFVSDYVRLYVLNKYGGVYLDVDVELTNSIDCFLENDFFIGFENWNNIININTALIGSTSGNQIISDLLDIYDHIHFSHSDGYVDITPNPFRFRELFNKYRPDSRLYAGDVEVEIMSSSKIFPWWYFCKKYNDEINYAIHHYASSWNDTPLIVDDIVRNHIIELNDKNVTQMKIISQLETWNNELERNNKNLLVDNQELERHNQELERNNQELERNNQELERNYRSTLEMKDELENSTIKATKNVVCSLIRKINR